MRGYRGRNGRLSVREEATFIQWCRAAVAYKAADPGDKQVALLRRRKVLAERHWRAFNAPLTRPRVRQRFGPTLRNLRGERLSPPAEAAFIQWHRAWVNRRYAIDAEGYYSSFANTSKRRYARKVQKFQPFINEGVI